ncbi:MAG: AbiJ-NTD4 domain-containing protein [Gemmatimonadaceae bacterium]
MTTFSERQGLTQPRQFAQVNGMDEPLRASLWNAAYTFYLNDPTVGLNVRPSERVTGIYFRLWRDFFKLPLDERPTGMASLREHAKQRFFAQSWDSVYDTLEFLFAIEEHTESWRAAFNQEVNNVLVREGAGYRLIDGCFVPIVSEIELESVKGSLSLPEQLRHAREHFSTAVQLLSDRSNPDYRNSIKESISAVESACSSIAGQEKADLDAALRWLQSRSKLHPALKKAFAQLYGYTSDADGIRHALLTEPHIDVNDARFMLVACSAFVNYLAANIPDAS